jgi:hypothetical protein
VIKDYPGDRARFRLHHRIADDRESFFADLVAGHEIMRRVVPDPIDRILGHECVDVDRAGAFQRHGIELLVFEHDVIAILTLVAFDLVLIVDRLAGFGIDVAALDAIARDPVESMEADLVRFRRGRQHRHRTGDERQLQIAFPKRSRRHRSALLR